MPSHIAIVTLGAFVLLYQAWVSFRIVRASEYEYQQKIFQLLLVWLFPIFGSIIAHMVLRASHAPAQKHDSDFTPEGPNA